METENDRPLSNHQEDLKVKYDQLLALHDATEKRLQEMIKTDERLKESEQRFKTVFDCSSVANKIINANLEILEANQAVLDLLGYSREHVVGSKIIEYTREDYKEQWQALQVELWEKQIPRFKFEACLIRQDKTEVWCIINSILFKDQDRTLGYTVLEDITVRKKNEQAKDQILEVVSHELKTPMASLNAYTQVLARLFKSESNTGAGVMLKKMSLQVLKLTRLIHDLLDVTRMDGGQLALNPIDYSFNELLDEAVNNVRLTTNYQVELQMEDNIHCHGDKDRTEQVLINLITNAIKYSPSKERIIVRLERKETELICSVQDFGMGISKKKQEKLFDRYFRVENDKTKNIAGLGLGLYISAQVIHQQKGKIWLESEEGKGSIFYFSLPCLG